LLVPFIVFCIGDQGPLYTSHSLAVGVIVVVTFLLLLKKDY